MHCKDVIGAVFHKQLCAFEKIDNLAYKRWIVILNRNTTHSPIEILGIIISLFTKIEYHVMICMFCREEPLNFLYRVSVNCFGPQCWQGHSYAIGYNVG